MRHDRLILVLLLLGIAAGSTSADVLTDQQMSTAVAMGRHCEAPIIRIAGRHDFDIYVETPLARAALVVATAEMMSQRLEAMNVRTAMRPLYGIWLDVARDTRQRFSFTTMTVWSRGVELRPTVVRDARLFLGTVPSHGIIEPLRSRHPEFLFDTLPAEGFEVVVHGASGNERYVVGDLRRAQPLRVCN